MTNNTEGCPTQQIIYNTLERLQFDILVYPQGLSKLVMIHCKLFRYHLHDNESFSFNIITDICKGHLSGSILTKLFLLVLKQDSQNL